MKEDLATLQELLDAIIDNRVANKEALTQIVWTMIHFRTLIGEVPPK